MLMEAYVMFSLKKTNKKPFVSVVIAAGGSSSRMHGENKLLAMIADKPVLAHTLLAFEKCDLIDAHTEKLMEYAAIATRYDIKKLAKVIKGGNTRLQSVYNAAIEVSPKCDYILVQDAARPLVTNNDIITVLEYVQEYKAAAASNKVTDTVKKTIDGFAIETIDRNTLSTVQTPQGADRDLLLAALRKALENEDGLVTDECSALELIGIKPYMAPCSSNNIKITYPEDLFLANAIYDRRVNECE